jgi:hypothetical protein
MTGQTGGGTSAAGKPIRIAEGYRLPNGARYTANCTGNCPKILRRLISDKDAF